MDLDIIIDQLASWDELSEADRTATLEAFADLTELTDEQLDEVEAALVIAYTQLREADTPDIAALRSLVETVSQVRAESETRAEAAAEAEAEMAELDAAVNPTDPDEGEGEEDEPSAETDDPEPGEDEPDDTDEPAAEEEPEPVPQAATAKKVTAKAPLSAIQANRPAANEPKPKAKANRPKVTAAADVPGFSAGQHYADLGELGKAFVDKGQATHRTRGATPGRYGVARLGVEYPEHLSLGTDAYENMRKINQVREQLRGSDYLETLTASGGVCAPEAPRYELFTLGDARRPIRDGLPRFGATRGGITFIDPPELTDVTGGVEVWTHATDAAPGEDTKDRVTISCGTQRTINLSAVVKRALVGNFDRLFYPEHFAAWWELLNVQHARVGDDNLWTQMLAGAGVVDVTTGELLGAARDILENLEQTAVQYRNRHRMDDDAVLDVVVDGWVFGVMRADLTRQHPGDDVLGITNGQIASYFTARNLNPILSPDINEFGAQTDGAALNRWPDTIEALVYAPGTYIFLDGGSLDLGTEVRDSTLNDTNDVEAFMETFEEVAMVGPEAVHVTMDICPSGTASSLTDISPCTTGS